MKLLRKIMCLVLSVCMIMTIIPFSLCSVKASTSLPSSIYLTQEGSRTCTLSSATMMLRARTYLSNNNNWSSITENGVRSKAWIENAGLLWNWSYSIGNCSMTVSHESVSGISVSSLKGILDKHPEGIVLYANNLPHAVFLTDYDGNVFYCADPVAGYSGKRISLESSSLGKRIGSQSAILSKVSAYWYISSYTIPSSGSDPIGVLDSVTGGYGTVNVRGWAFDKDNLNASTVINVYVGGVKRGTLTANGHRADVNKVYQCGEYHGFSGTITVDKTIAGTQKVDVYAVNVGGGNDKLIGSKTITILTDTERPVITDVKVTNINSTGYTVSCIVNDNVQVDHVQFPTWTLPSQDDIQDRWPEKTSTATGTKNGNLYTYRVEIKDHKNEGGPYITHIYAYDTYGNSTAASIASSIYVQYEIKYDMNGGSGGPSEQLKVYNRPLELSNIVPQKDFIVTYDGNGGTVSQTSQTVSCVFSEWNTQMNGTGTSYAPKEVYNADENMTLYAQWKSPEIGILQDAQYEGYEFDGWYTSPTDGEKVTSDTIIDKDITLYAHWNIRKDIFEDVHVSDWFYDAVYYNYCEGFMTGLNETTFGPFENMTRAQLVVVLYRIEGEENITYKTVFTDIPNGEWYTDAVLWAKENGIVNGYEGTGLFGPHDLITREQIALIMQNYAAFKSYNIHTIGDLNSFEDSLFISEYAKEAMKWAVGNGIINGKNNGTLLDPQGSALRAEVATIIWRFMQTFNE